MRQTAYSQHIMAIIRQRGEVGGTAGAKQRRGGGGGGSNTIKLKDENSCIKAAWMHNSYFME